MVRWERVVGRTVPDWGDGRIEYLQIVRLSAYPEGVLSCADRARKGDFSWPGKCCRLAWNFRRQTQRWLERDYDGSTYLLKFISDPCISVGAKAKLEVLRKKRAGGRSTRSATIKDR